MTLPASSAVTKRSLTIAGHRTSISLEDAFWAGLREIAGRRHFTPAALVEEIDRHRGEANLSSAIRVFVLDNLHRRDSPTISQGVSGAPGGSDPTGS